MTRVTGMMGFWADIDDSYVNEYRRWHNCEHMLERVSIPGFVSGRRYCGTEDAAMFFMSYETETPGVLGSDAYHAALNNPTRWTSEALTHFRNPARNIYRLIGQAGLDVSEAFPFVATMRFNLTADEAAVLRTYKDSVLTELSGRDLSTRARLWEVDEEISGMMTSERKIYGGGPGSQKYLLLIESQKEREAPMPKNLPGLDVGDAAQHTDVFAESGWLDFALSAPSNRAD